MVAILLKQLLSPPVLPQTIELGAQPHPPQISVSPFHFPVGLATLTQQPRSLEDLGLYVQAFVLFEVL